MRYALGWMENLQIGIQIEITIILPGNKAEISI
jgi:hypothetical protein